MKLWSKISELLKSYMKFIIQITKLTKIILVSAKETLILFHLRHINYNCLLCLFLFHTFTMLTF
jgi:hypothetical protein